MAWTQVKSLPVNINSSDFWTAVNVWNRVPHVLNRRICGIEILHQEKIKNDLDGTKLKAAVEDAKFSCLSTKHWNEENVFKILKTIGLSLPCTHTDKISNGELILKRLLPKNNEHYKPCLELEILDHQADVATYVALFYSESEPVLTPHIPYRLALVRSDDIGESSLIELSVCKMQIIESLGRNESNLTTDKSIEWLQNNLLPKFCKWAELPSNASIGSLKLVPVDQYNSLYHSLKAKYAQNLIKMWPESTDPKKFIHEDLGIATYLLLLWKQERKDHNTDEMQTFVDVGCGNGLLVYILSEEGHCGLGVDVRSRQIWNLYPPSTKLKVCTVNPLQEIPFPAADWLIGNHSDELTPWIPVMAAMSPHSRFFVLPCCPYDFYCRYSRKNPGRSIYQEYLEFIQKEVCENLCKFTCQLDRLRIPSTKRICIVGSRSREEKREESPESIPPSKFLAFNLGYKAPRLTHALNDAEKCNSFVPRPVTEKVRNCTQLEAGVITDVVSLVAAELLSEVKEEHKLEGRWNCGKKVSLEVLARKIPAHLLLKLKKESGGLQTLLKNNHFIFKVVGGMVEFRKPVVRDNPKFNTNSKSNLNGKRGKNRWKSRPCWFHLYHPDGCPLENAQCSYIHAP